MSDMSRVRYSKNKDMTWQGDHYPGNQGKVREIKRLKYSGKCQRFRNFNRLSKLKVLPLIRLKLVILVSAKTKKSGKFLRAQGKESLEK